MVSQKIRRVALLMRPERQFSRDLIKGVLRYAQTKNSWIFYNEPSYILAPQENQRKCYLRECKVDGIIMREAKDTKQIIELGIPVIVSPYKVGRILGVPNIVCDDYKVGKMAAEHLLDQGFQNFAFIGIVELYHPLKRREGFSETIRQAGFEVFFFERIKSVRQFSWQSEKQMDVLAKWLRGLPKPLGVMSSPSEIGSVVVNACKRAGLSMPEQIALVTTDNDELVYDLYGQTISSVVYDTIKAGYKAAELLDDMMDRKEVGDTIITVNPTHIETRSSTNILAIEEKEVAKAINFIRVNSRYNIDVSDVLNYVSLSRTKLNECFKRFMGRTVHQEILRVRVNEIIKLLLNTELTISQIAFELGFPDDNHISRFFKGQEGLTPGEYRRKHRVQSL